MTDWTTCRVVRDRDERLWMRYSTRSWESEDPGEPDTNTAGLGSNYGPITPVLDADGQPVVHTVGDLTARHIRHRPQILLRVGDAVGTLYAGRVLALVTRDRTIDLTIDTPCEVLP